MAYVEQVDDMEKSTFVEGVPDRMATKYSNEYLKVLVKLTEISSMDEDLSGALGRENFSVSRYVKRRHALQNDYEHSLVHGNMENASEVKRKIAALSDPLSYIIVEPFGLDLSAQRIEGDWHTCVSEDGRYLTVQEAPAVATPRNYISLPEVIDYAHSVGLN
jgi:hypothetical protein